MKAYLLSLNPDASVADQWDYGFLKDFLEGRMWKPTNWSDFDIQRVTKLQNTPTAVVAIPARHHAGLESKVNTELQKIDNVVLFLLGDEEADFDIEKIDHKSIHIWVQNPHMGKHDQYDKIGTGYPPHMKLEYKEKDLDMFFSGQITHSRRKEMVKYLPDYCERFLSSSFTGGLNPDEYYEYMSRTKVAPAPSGAVIPDSFRLFEALEAMAIPIAEERGAKGEMLGYWTWLFGQEPPFPTLTDWSNLSGYGLDMLGQWPSIQHKQTEWYIKYKRSFAYKVMEQLHA